MRRLNDGREFRIVKVYWSQEELQKSLFELGWDAVVNKTERFFVYGTGQRRR
ncbi:MAG: hypothetical protein ACRD1T_05945 [Acidimicrobiia bacterium]